MLMIFILHERAYAISYQLLIVTLAISLTVSEIWPFFRRISYPCPFNPEFENAALARNR